MKVETIIIYKSSLLRSFLLTFFFFKEILNCRLEILVENNDYYNNILNYTIHTNEKNKIVLEILYTLI